MYPLLVVKIKVKTNLGSSKKFNFYQFVNILTNFDTIIYQKENYFEQKQHILSFCK